MATLTNSAMTYSEWALRHDPTGKVSVLVNMMSQSNEILNDMLAVECQAGASYYWTQVTALPTPSRRAYNQGVARSLAGVAKQVTVCEEYGSWVVSDKSLIRLGGHMAELRTQEVMLHAEKIGQAVAYDLFYGSRIADPLSITGLSNIYNTNTAATSPISGNVIDGAGAGSDNASVWLITWGPNQIITCFPKGLPTGLETTDYGDLPVSDSNGLEFPGYRTYLQWNIGLAVKDWRYGVRIANIDVSDLAGATPYNLLTGLAQMVNKTPTQPAGVGPVQTTDDPFRLETGRSAIYVNRTIHTWLSIQASNKTNMLLTMAQWGGQSVLTYRGIPIRIVDALLTSESEVV